MPQRSRVLWVLFGALASVAATTMILLFWLIRRPGKGRPSSQDPLEPGQVDPGQHAPEPPVVQPPSDNGSGCELSCGDSCGDACDNSCDGACDNAVDSVCDDLVNEVCQKPMDDVCGSFSGCDSGINCQSTIAGSGLAQLLAGAQPWLFEPVRAKVTVPARIGIAVIRLYQRHISGRLGTHCRYSPSCSEYAVEALRGYGALDGSMRAIARIRRCTASVPCGTLDPAINRLRVSGA